MFSSSYTTLQIKIGDTAYPKHLKNIPNPPKELYVKGEFNTNYFDNAVLGIVGSRKMTGYGKAVLEHIFEGLSREKIVTVSGFTRGIDAAGHELSIKNRIPTVAVLPCGIETIYPSNHASLFVRILKSGGLVVSEYPGDVLPRSWTFVNRNRIVAGLCDVLLVVEAGENSGSLLTYEYAKKFGKKVTAVPGDIFNENQKGICQIIKNGAKPIFSGRDINEELSLPQKSSVIEIFDICKESKNILSILNNAPVNINELSRLSNLRMEIISTQLTLLELKGLVREIKGFYYVVKS
jgi:DNA processing protein